jgi:Ricin-type beta-trefoil lectin domain
MLNFNLTSFVSKLSAMVVFLLLLIANTKSVSAWTWVLHHQGQALNTNNNFQRINNGGPRLSTWALNHNDPDQRIGFVGNGNHSDGSFKFMLVQQSTGLCLNVLNPAPNVRVNTYTCNRNDPEQQWKLNVLRDYGNGALDVTVQVSNTNLCLDNYDRLNGSVVQVHYCNTANSNHVWRMDKVSEYIPTIAGGVPVSTPKPPVVINTNLSGGQIYTPKGFSLNTNFGFPRFPNADSGAVQMKTWLSDINDPDQRFSISQLSTGSVMIKHLKTNYCLDSTNNLSNNQPVIVWQCDVNNSNQQWDIVTLGNGFKQIRRKGSSVCLDAPDATNGGRVHLIVCEQNGLNTNQHFTIGQEGYAKSIDINQAKLAIENAKIFANQYSFNRAEYASGLRYLEQGVKFNDVLRSSYARLSNGQLRFITDTDWKILLSGGQVNGLDPALQLVYANGQKIDTLGKIIDAGKVYVAATKDYQNLVSGYDGNVVPFADTGATVAGILADKAVVSFYLAAYCIPLTAATGPLGGLACAGVAVYSGVVIGNVVEREGKYVLNEIITRDNVVGLYNNSKQAAQTTTNTYFPKTQKDLDFVKGLCRALGGGCI